MSKIQVKNVSSATVVITAPDVRLRRELVPGRIVPLTQEEFDELSFDPGMQNLLRAGYLQVKGVDEESKQIVENAVQQADEEQEQELEIHKRLGIPLAACIDRLQQQHFALLLRAADAQRDWH